MKRETKLKIVTALGVVLVVLLLTVFLFSGENSDLLKSLFADNLSNEELQNRLRDFGLRGWITTAVLSMLQLICTFLPAEPVQVLAGLTFGFPVGLLCCWAGVFLGATVIYLLQRSFGDQLRHLFVKTLGLDLEQIANSNKSTFVIFLLYFLPAIPYGMICFVAAGLGMRYRRYIVVNLLGALPSVCIGVALGYMTIATNWVVTVCVFGLFIIFALIVTLNREKLFAKLNAFAAKPQYSSKTKVRKCSGLLMDLFYGAFRAYYFLCGIRLKTKNKCKEPLKGPCIVLCNHGSFIDFIYATALLRKSRPHFVAARLYFYHRILGGLLKALGCFPKSMFALDIESTKNSVRVLHDGGVLAMMPEARLSTAGRFEDVQESTYAFLKKSGVPVYSIKISGDYLANPKWGKGVRRGALVEAELDILFTAQELLELTEQQIKASVEQRLYYDDFAWLQTRPKIRYRNRKIAEGLENILTVCPKCHGRYTITTKKNAVFCAHCGLLTRMDGRYQFGEDFQFQNLAQWYDWQKDFLQQKILQDPDYVLTSKVELRLPGEGKSLTRHAGEGICTLSREGLRYVGSRDGETVEIHFTVSRIYRLLFGAGENFEIYNGSEILYFVPEERRSAVDWYMTSMILYDNP